MIRFGELSDPVVSVVMTVFRRTEYLEEAIRSVLSQTFVNFALIVTDDAASEEARGICDKFMYDARVRYRCNRETLGAPLNIAAAMDEVESALVTIVNDDDVLEPDMLAQLVPPMLADPKCALAFGDHWLMDRNGALHTKQQSETRSYAAARVLRRASLASPSKLRCGRWFRV